MSRVLVGLDQEHLFLPLDSKPMVESEDRLVRAFETLLGWTITGPDVFNQMAPTIEVACPALHDTGEPCTNDLLDKPCTNTVLSQQFKRFNDLDGVGIMFENDKFTRKHKLQIQYFKEKSRFVDGRWKVPMLVEKPGPLPNSEHQALREIPLNPQEDGKRSEVQSRLHGHL